MKGDEGVEVGRGAGRGMCKGWRCLERGGGGVPIVIVVYMRERETA